MSDSGTIVDGGQPKGKSQEDGLASSGAESTSTSASASPNNSSSRNNNKRPIKKRNHSSIDDHRSALSEELEAAASLVTVSTAAFVSAPAPKRPKGDNSNGTNSNPNPKNNVGVMEGDKSNDEEEDEEGGRSNDEEDEEGDSSSSEQSESAATTSSLSGSDDCVEAKGDNTNGRGNGNDSSSQKKKKKAKKPGLRKGKWTVRLFSVPTVIICFVFFIRKNSPNLIQCCLSSHLLFTYLTIANTHTHTARGRGLQYCCHPALPGGPAAPTGRLDPARLSGREAQLRPHAHHQKVRRSSLPRQAHLYLPG